MIDVTMDGPWFLRLAQSEDLLRFTSDVTERGDCYVAASEIGSYGYGYKKERLIGNFKHGK